MRVRVLAVGLVCALAAVGCGGGAKSVDGTVVLGGKSYDPAANGDLSVNITKDGGGGAATGQVKSDGSFRLESPDGKGIPPGKYRVNITRYPTAAEAGKKGGMSGAVSKDTGEVWDVGTGGPFVLDMSKVK